MAKKTVTKTIGVNTVHVNQFNAEQQEAFTRDYIRAEKKKKPPPMSGKYMYDRNYGYVCYDDYIAVWGLTKKQAEYKFNNELKRMKLK